jgi:hypothetical protein
MPLRDLVPRGQTTRSLWIPSQTNLDLPLRLLRMPHLRTISRLIKAKEENSQILLLLLPPRHHLRLTRTMVLLCQIWRRENKDLVVVVVGIVVVEVEWEEVHRLIKIEEIMMVVATISSTTATGTTIPTQGAREEIRIKEWEGEELEDDR